APRPARRQLLRECLPGTRVRVAQFDGRVRSADHRCHARRAARRGACTIVDRDSIAARAAYSFAAGDSVYRWSICRPAGLECIAATGARLAPLDAPLRRGYAVVAFFHWR